MIDPQDITTKHRSTTSVLVHADGPPCHGTPLRRDPHVGGSYYCPRCHAHPDMQSIEYWAPERVVR